MGQWKKRTDWEIRGSDSILPRSLPLLLTKQSMHKQAGEDDNIWRLAACKGHPRCSGNVANCLKKIGHGVPNHQLYLPSTRTHSSPCALWCACIGIAGFTRDPVCASNTKIGLLPNPSVSISVDQWFICIPSTQRLRALLRADSFVSWSCLKSRV